MAWVKYFRLFSISALLLCTNCNVIRLGQDVNDNILLSDENMKKNEVTEDKNHIRLDDNLKDTEVFNNGKTYIHEKITLVHHFARHGLCRNTEGKSRFYTAMKSKFCHTKRKFLSQLVDDLCANNDSHLDNWVAELFDLNDDGFVDHFEKKFYEHED